MRRPHQLLSPGAIAPAQTTRTLPTNSGRSSKKPRKLGIAAEGTLSVVKQMGSEMMAQASTV
jgi:hypothetical protein